MISHADVVLVQGHTMAKIFAGSVIFVVIGMVATASVSTKATAGSGGGTGKISLHAMGIPKKVNSASPSLYNGPPAKRRNTNGRIKY
jgi:type VI protein secretion system component Hcp